jgi:hypothetical protein
MHAGRLVRAGALGLALAARHARPAIRRRPGIRQDDKLAVLPGVQRMTSTQVMKRIAHGRPLSA